MTNVRDDEDAIPLREAPTVTYQYAAAAKQVTSAAGYAALLTL